MTDAGIRELVERSKQDEKIIVGSEIRDAIDTLARRAERAEAALRRFLEADRVYAASNRHSYREAFGAASDAARAALAQPEAP